MILVLPSKALLGKNNKITIAEYLRPGLVPQGFTCILSFTLQKSPSEMETATAPVL